MLHGLCLLHVFAHSVGRGRGNERAALRSGRIPFRIPALSW